MMWQWGTISRWLYLIILWEWVLVAVHCRVATTSNSDHHESSGHPLEWLLSDRGPFYQSQQYTEFSDRFQQGFTTRYRIYREFGRWQVTNLVTERRDKLNLPLPLSPEFLRNLRLLGRRPTLQQITENLIKKYGTHFFVSATLGGEESLTIFVDKQRLAGRAEGRHPGSNLSSVTLETLHQLAASYFIDRESTLRRLHHIQIATAAIKVTETRTGPLGCSNYDNLDSVSSVLVQSPENKIQLQGLQVLLPDYLRERFVQAALSYTSCNLEGEFICKNNDCWCQCAPTYPECNCPRADVLSVEENLHHVAEVWEETYQKFEDSVEFKSFVKSLPMDHFLNTSSISHLWTLDSILTHRYDHLGNILRVILRKYQKLVHKLLALSRRCWRQPKFKLLRERSWKHWLNRAQSLLYCSENNLSGVFSEEAHKCRCPSGQVSCSARIPCTVGNGPACVACAVNNRTYCASCNSGYMLNEGGCQPEVSEATEHYITFDSQLQDLEVKYLLQKRDSRIEVQTIFISNDIRLNNWFDPSWRKRMLVTLKSNKYKTNLVHMMLGLSLQICLTVNSTLEPSLAVYINPFGGSHSESWLLPVNENSFPDWERTKLDSNHQCYNWTMMLGNRLKTFFETVHVYLRSRIISSDLESNETLFYEPLEKGDPSNNLGYMRINHMRVFGYSMHFDSEAILDLIMQLDYPYTQGSQDSALLQLLEIRDRVNKLSPPGKHKLDLFSCLLSHRLKLSSSVVGRILATLKAFSAKLPNSVDYETIKLCS
ncbi:BMP/retinoic acid-inducible neural-specific protein 3-like [Protopterus annectens]|uniref:BMP/retinoic acid-inducible neural-specific protein 3-like n=1 Tax=Protopterus annectens TaxID=7888 RepID=UPI001CFBDC2F|nr:BMP/retinoic acid-inducible neural-specific protein 3-like [Protopterus annectens]XP_043941908.1 BMP/retinoic acid-inducible neural-specific protein 3-like [Protopterus annectens]